MPTPRSVQHRLALAGVALVLTAAVMGLFTPLRDFYHDLITGSATSARVENLSNTAGQLIAQQRLDDAQDLLQQAIELDPDNHSLRITEFTVSTWQEFYEAFDFDASYNPGKRYQLLPLIVEGYRLAYLTEDDVERSRILAHISLLHYFDPEPEPGANIEAVLRQAIALDESNAIAWMVLGFLLEDEQRHDEAVASWTEAVRYEPDEGVAWAALGQYYADTGDYDAALDAYVHAYHSGRPALGYQMAYRKQRITQGRVTELLLEDLLTFAGGRRTLTLTDNQRQKIIDELGIDDWQVHARMHALAGRYADAARLAWAELESLQIGFWGLNEIAALNLLFELEPELPVAERRESELVQAGEMLTSLYSISAVTPPADFDVLWVRGAMHEVVRITPQSRLFQAGLRLGDRIIGVAGRSVESETILSTLLSDASGKDFPVLVLRNMKPVVLKVTGEEQQ